MSKLSEHMLVAPANVTGLVDRMERKGYVRRKRHESDRRLYLIEPTSLGTTVFRSIYSRFHSYVESIGQDLTKEEMNEVIVALRKVLSTVERTREI